MEGTKNMNLALWGEASTLQPLNSRLGMLRTIIGEKNVQSSFRGHGNLLSRIEHVFVILL
jgi:hypothetical protein